MALVRHPTYSLTVSWKDRDNNKATTVFNVDTVNTMVEMTLALEGTIIPAMQALSDAVVTGWSINSAAVDTAILVAPEISDVERKGVFSFAAENGSTYLINIPSIKNTLVVDDTNVIDRSAAPVIAFVDMVISDTILALVRPRTYVGNDITRLLSVPKKKHRNNPRG